MRAPTPLARFAARLRLPGRTVRLRLTLLYGSLFILSGAALLTITYLLVSSLVGNIKIITTPVATQGGAGPAVPGSSGNQPSSGGSSQVHGAYLHQLLVESEIALAIMAVVCVGLGWLVAGRVLRPLRTMTATTRRISEENLHERLAVGGPRDELSELADTIDGLLARLEAAFEAQRRFVANASHELRTPLAMMRTSLDVAVGKPQPVPREVTILAGKLRQGLDQADRLIESFLLLARAQQGALTDRARLSLSKIVSAAVLARGPAARDLGIDIQHDLTDAEVTGSETLLARMVANVLDNALRHGRPGEVIHVSTAVDSLTARLVIDSSGAVLDEAMVQQLGQPFRRLGADRTASDNGVGLGLSIVGAIATAHGGSLTLRARAEGGLRVIIALPHATRALPAGAPR
jgi:signal transduction histidine kinase